MPVIKDIKGQEQIEYFTYWRDKYDCSRISNDQKMAHVKN